MPVLLLTLHLWSASAPARPLHLLPPLRLGQLPQAAPPALTAPVPAPAPPQDQRYLVMTTEVGAGALALALNDGLLLAADLALLLTFVEGLISGSGSGASLAVGSILALVLVNVLDALAVPFIAALATWGTARLWGDDGARFWRALLGAGAAQVLLTAGTFLVLTIESAALQGAGTSGSNAVGFTLLGAAAIQLVLVPLAASVGLHWGEEVVPQPRGEAGPAASPRVLPPAPPPPILPPAPAGPEAPPPVYPGTFVFPLLAVPLG